MVGLGVDHRTARAVDFGPSCLVPFPSRLVALCCRTPWSPAQANGGRVDDLAPPIAPPIIGADARIRAPIEMGSGDLA